LWQRCGACYDRHVAGIVVVHGVTALQRHSVWRPALFKLFRRKQRDDEAVQPEAGAPVEPDELESEAAEPEAGQIAVAIAQDEREEPEIDEIPAEAEEGPAFDEAVEERTEEALRPTRRGFFRRMFGVFERSQIDDELWDELEEILILADTGAETTDKILNAVRQRVRREGMKQPEEARDALKDELVALLESVEDLGQLWGEQDGAGADGRAFQPAVILVVGVNGVGKTTSIAKLARAFRRDGERVILAAGDTFRAAAIEQLKLWGERVGAPVIAHQQGQDASAVVFDAMAAARKRNADVVLIDTAGRLHSKSNLMEELKKINRVVQRSDETAPHEVLLVIDAVTGQNGLAQAKTFAEAVGVTAIFLTKLDGTAKGGIVFAIADQLGIPVRFIGTGEKSDDMAPFDPNAFVDALFTE
jgi:fused signal recognition particle receptor